jgi:hypothetical protein
MKPELKTQADRWRWLLDGNKIKHNDFIVGFKDNILWNYTQQTKTYMAFTDNEDCVPYIEPMKDEFECVVDTKWHDRHDQSGAIVDHLLDKYIGKRVKIKIEEIV